MNYWTQMWWWFSTLVLAEDPVVVPPGQRGLLLQFQEHPDVNAPLKGPIFAVKTSGGLQSFPLMDNGTQGDASPGDGRWAHWVTLPNESALVLSVYDQSVSGAPLYQAEVTLPEATKVELRVEHLAGGYSVNTQAQLAASPTGTESPGKLGAAGAAVPQSPYLVWAARGGTVLVALGSLIAVIRRRRRPPQPRLLGRMDSRPLFDLPGFPEVSAVWVMEENEVLPAIKAVLSQIKRPVLLLAGDSIRQSLDAEWGQGIWTLAAPDPLVAVEAARRLSAVILVEGPSALARPFRGEKPEAPLEELLRRAPGPVLVLLRPGETVPEGLRAIRVRVEDGRVIPGDAMGKDAEDQDKR